MRNGFVSRLRIGVAMIAIGGASLLALPGVASAKTYNPKNTEEFETAVKEANEDTNTEANTIVISGSTYYPVKTVVIKNTKDPLTIEGPAGSPTTPAVSIPTLSGLGMSEIEELLEIVPGANLTIRNVEIDFAGGEGHPAIEDAGALTVEDDALVNVGTSVLVQSEATLTARNTTISDGRSYGVANYGTASFYNSTIAYNKGVGIQNVGEALHLTNTIVAENKGGDCIGSATTSDHSLDSNGSCGVGALSHTNPDLAKSLTNAGGATPIHALESGSPAIGAGDQATCLTTDQRGAPRPGICGRRMRHRRVRV